MYRTDSRADSGISKISVDNVGGALNNEGNTCRKYLNGFLSS
ncbi:MAG TPA: hypothetical protein VFW07_23080 [Parafilimonas sp.]|nr:hypothetical protein [Parafilimonas sp.]